MYEVVLTDRATNVPQGEVTNFSSFSFFRGLSKLATVSFTVRLDNEHVDRLSAAFGNIKVYRDKVLVFHGPIISAEEQAERETQSVAVTCSDAAWVLSRRLLAQPTPAIYALAARSAIFNALMVTTNAAGETGVDYTTLAWTSGSSITHKIEPYTPVLTTLQQLGTALDGFDWLVRPRENWANGASTSVKLGNLDLQTVIGANKPNAVFEYGVGTRSNVLSYGLTTTRDGQANKVYHLDANARTEISATDATSIATWGLLQDQAAGDFTDATYRQKLVDEHVRVRKYPRTLVRMTPTIDPGNAGQVPEPFVDYDVGDTITARMIHGRKVRFAGFLRVFGIRTTLDNGFERVELILEDDT